VARAYIHQRRAQSALETDDIVTMNREFKTACELIGDNPEIRFWHAIGLLSAGEIDDGITILREIAAHNRNWITLALRLPPPLLKTDPEMLERIRQLI